MANLRALAQTLGPVGHLPTWMLVIGTGAFWIELFFIPIPGGHTSWLAWCLWLGIVAFVLRGTSQWSLPNLSFIDKVALSLICIYVLIILYASLLPPHLPQEFDAINYHLMLPRQHLIAENFFHIPWSVPDLFLLPLDYALAPFALCTTLPNKFPQFLFFIGCIMLAYQLIVNFSKGNKQHALLGVMAFLALHIIAIQAGTAMLDLVMLYCALACVHSLCKGRFVMAAIEGSFLFWSKSFMPIQMVLITLGIMGLVFVLKRCGFTLEEKIVITKKNILTLMVTGLLVSVCIASPHLLRSFYYTGSPLYPLGVGIMSPVKILSSNRTQAIKDRANDSVAIKDAYGEGKGIIAFMKHFWIMAVPTKGVNNHFDYPLGLMYLLMLFPFLLMFFAFLGKKKIPILALTICAWWGVWWFGSQQSRFLIIPISMLVIMTIAHMKDIGRVLITLIMFTMVIEIVSLTNAHRPDWGKSTLDVLRPKDKEILQLTSQKKHVILHNEPDVAFAETRIQVESNDSIYVFPR